MKTQLLLCRQYFASICSCLLSFGVGYNQKLGAIWAWNTPLWEKVHHWRTSVDLSQIDSHFICVSQCPQIFRSLVKLQILCQNSAPCQLHLLNYKGVFFTFFNFFNPQRAFLTINSHYYNNPLTIKLQFRLSLFNWTSRLLDKYNSAWCIFISLSKNWICTNVERKAMYHKNIIELNKLRRFWSFIKVK